MDKDKPFTVAELPSEGDMLPNGEIVTGLTPFLDHTVIFTADNTYKAWRLKDVK